MSPAAEILVIILSIFLAFFLVLGTVLIIYLINLTRQIRKVTSSAERTAYNLESVVENVTKLTSPILLAGIIINFVKKFKKNKGDK